MARHPEASYSKGSELPPLKPGVIRLYSMRFCPYAQKARLIMAHKGIECETINVDLFKKPDWFFDKNPLGAVPVMEKDGEVIFESDLCAEWLNANFPEKSLIPDTSTLLQWKMLATLYAKKVLAPYYKHAFGPADASEMIKGLKWLDGKLDGKPFFSGSEFAMGDIYIWPWIERMPALGVDMAVEAPNLHAWCERMKEVPAVKRCLHTTEDHKTFFENSRKREERGHMDYDYGLKPV